LFILQRCEKNLGRGGKETSGRHGPSGENNERFWGEVVVGFQKKKALSNPISGHSKRGKERNQAGPGWVKYAQGYWGKMTTRKEQPERLPREESGKPGGPEKDRGGEDKTEGTTENWRKPGQLNRGKRLQGKKNQIRGGREGNVEKRD